MAIGKGPGLRNLSVAITAALALSPIGGDANAKTMETDAIIGTGRATDAIIGTGRSADAIIGTGRAADAIIGTGKTTATDAIIGTGRNADAIIGTGRATDAIIGTGRSADAIIGTGRAADAIIGTGRSADAIIGTGKATSTGTVAQTLLGEKSILAIQGPVESVNKAQGTIRVLSRTFRLPSDSSLLSAVGDAVTAGQMPQVAIVAKVGADGSVSAAALRTLPQQYIAGASLVALTGRVTSIDSTRGVAIVSGVAVDYTSLLSAKNVNISVGSVVRVVGTQPIAAGSMLASEILNLSRP